MIYFSLGGSGESGGSMPYYETSDGKIGLLVIDVDNKFGVFTLMV